LRAKSQRNAAHIADQLETHAHDELKHALIISRQFDYLGKMPLVTPKSVQDAGNSRVGGSISRPASARPSLFPCRPIRSREAAQSKVLESGLGGVARLRGFC
jgi:hypothetical protein